MSHPASTEAGTVIEGMAALASNNVWAVGEYDNLVSGGSEDRIEHWNGVSWSSSSAGTILQSEGLRAVAGKTANDVWAVGSYIDAAHGNVAATEIKHWDGVSWSLVSSPNAMSGGSPINSYLSSVVTLASNDVWAVGSAGTSDAGATLIEHWDGAQWSIVASPNVNGSDSDGLAGVSGSGSNDVWAVGLYTSLSASGGPLIEHWNGSSWSIVTINPALMGGEFLGVTATSLGNIWAVGYQLEAGTGNILTLIERWNGSAWTLQRSPPLTPGGIQLLDAVTASPDGVALTVGYYSTSTEASQTLAIRLGLGRR